MNKTDLGTNIADFVMQNKEKYYRLAYQYVQNRNDALVGRVSVTRISARFN